jgi:zona occludens toxin (predicted ATPase)
VRRPNLRIIGIKENENSQLKGPVNIFNRIIEENVPYLKKEMPMNTQVAYRTPNRLDQKRNSSCHIIVKTPNVQNKEIILKTIREKGQVTYKGRPIRITPEFSPETMKARRTWEDVMQTQMPAQATIPSKTLNYHRQRNQDIPQQTKFTQYLYTDPALQRITDFKKSTQGENFTLEKARK